MPGNIQEEFNLDQNPRRKGCPVAVHGKQIQNYFSFRVKCLPDPGCLKS